MEKKRVVAYCRVSTDSSDQANSFENQKSYFEREILKNPDYEFVGIYADKGVSGTKLQRLEFERMLEDAGIDVQIVPNRDNDERKEFIRYRTVPSSSRKPKFDLILTKNTSRFARNTEVEIILRDLASNKVYVHFLDLNKTTENVDDITYIQIFQSFDERDSRDKSKKVIFGINEGIKRGVIHTNSKLFGYEYIKSENRLEIIPEEAKIIQKIFELYSENNGARVIGNYLRDNKIKTRKNNDFGKSTIARIINNEKYAGYNNPLKYDTGIVLQNKSYPKIRDNYDVVKSDKIPAIITKELFDKCQSILKNKVNYKKSKGIYKGNSKYNGIIYCGSCGSVYHSNQDRGRIFYNCFNKKLHSIKACNNPNISEHKIDTFIEMLAQGGAYETIDKQKYYSINVLSRLMLKKFEQLDSDKELIAKQLSEQIENENRVLDNLYELYSRSNANKDILMSKINILESKIKKLENELKNNTKDNNKIENEIVELYDLYDSIINMEYKKEIYTEDEIMSFVEMIVIKPDKSIVACIYKAEEIRGLVKKYKDELGEIKPLSKEEIEDLDMKLETVINFT